MFPFLVSFLRFYVGLIYISLGCLENAAAEFLMCYAFGKGKL